MHVRAAAEPRRAAPDIPLILAGIVLALAVAVRIPVLAGGQLDYDEGVYWQSLRAMAAGHPLFSSVYSSQPPAFLALLLPSHLLLGGSVAADRLPVLLLSLAATVAVYRTAGQLAGRWAGLLGAAVLAADPLFFRQSVTLQADGPSVALVAIALAVATEANGRPTGRAALAMAAAAALFALAVLTKLFAAAAAPVLLVPLLASPLRPAALGARLAAAAGGGLAAALLVLLPYAGDLATVWRQSVGFHLGARSLPVGGIDNATLLLGLPLVVLAAAGTLCARRRAPLLALTGLAWLVPAALFLFVQHPVWSHHLVLLVPPLALLAGGIALLLEPEPDAAAARLPAAALGAAALLVAAPIASAAYVHSQQQPDAVLEPTVAALHAATGPGDEVVTDDQFAAALAGRSTPPELVDTSQVRVLAGELTSAEAESIAGRPGVRAVLLASGRLERLPGFREWVAARFPDARDLGDGRVLYVRPGR